jgi:EAL domain-containing protein (putative c-di-GMP-specific phosphodiesterase class I)
VVLRRTASNAVDAVSCAFGAFIATEKHHALVQRGNEQKQVLTELRHLVDSLRHPLSRLLHTHDEPVMFASADLAPMGAAEHKLIAYPVRKADRQLAALLLLVRRRHEQDFNAADCAALRDVAMRIPAHVIDELAPFSHESGSSSAPVEIVRTHLERTPLVSIADPVRRAPSLDKQLRAALRNDGFDLHVQSIAPLRSSSQTTRYEVLLRLRQEDSLQLPQTFLEAAEQSHLLPDIDRWVVGRLLNAVRPHIESLQAGRWEFALNVSAASLQRESFGDFIEAQLFRSGVPPQALVFEFSEYDVLAHRQAFETLARRLVDLGCRVALDNCRQGIDIFLAIGRLPVHRLKIDAALTHHITTDTRAAHAVRELVEVARDVGVETVGEQIEDDATFQMLRDLGIDFAQGFTIARPRPLSELFQ